MVNLRLTIVLLFLSTTLFSQTKKIERASIADCDGAINLFKSGLYTLQFTGGSGNVNELSNYPSLTDLSEDNIIWISFIAPAEGKLSIDASIDTDYLEMIIFEETENNICTELPRGIAEIKRIQKSKTLKNIGLDFNVREGFLYPMEMYTNQKILIGLMTTEKSQSIVRFNLDFKATNNSSVQNETKIIDNRSDEFAPSISIIVRDAETNEPIIANLTIEGSKELNALYSGSDIFMNHTKSTSVFIKCDADGYFFVDKEVKLDATKSIEIELKMDRLTKGKSMQIEEIEFKPGTSEFVQGAEGKLNRLKDFMASNADLSIEIQGHVFSIGENSLAAQKLSEARAKRVMNFLIDNGISRDRLTAVGYGNTKPIYPNAKLGYEEQANRRVEIVVK
jgi:outer membrane protein OmpA-like peptidoglycan-associated protein